MRGYMHGFVFVMGLALVVGGIITRILGASIVGLIVAGVNSWNWWKCRDERSDSEEKEPPDRR